MALPVSINRLNLCKSFFIQIKSLKNLQLQSVAKYSNEVTVVAAPLAVQKQKTSKAMKAYLERARGHDEFMKAQTLEYQIGKRHLANMMGEDPETFTQEDIDNAIEYLFPSGLFQKRARPLMKEPAEIFPPRKAAEFDATGRPFHSMFYTGRPNFFKLLYDIVEEINNLNDFEDKMIRKGTKPDPNLKLESTGYHWLPKEQLEKKLVENISDIEYSNFIQAMDRLISLPYSYKSKDFIQNYRKILMDPMKNATIPKPLFDEDGRQYVTTYECLRKKARGDVTVRYPGTGLLVINGQDIHYFDNIQSKEQILFPLIFTDMLNKVDIEANVEGGGPSGQAGAIRWGIAMSLRSFVDEETIEKMRLAGLLTRDWRTRERKKFGQEGARRKYTWKKR
ncbi:28S ribosomal protein S9, mitochondrial [Condylostylus longicornis]|uniref:28S ribosomal protein S9, mitochondrial n=1 Tax=Condylostylus longicornis TaxID=2530218 RepID=UPI00244E1098|nr:28S ribosomal protein S9, mitochondrial [Condylostylus longicornis]